jgi:hypothetical protein
VIDVNVGHYDDNDDNIGFYDADNYCDDNAYNSYDRDNDDSNY